MIISGRHRFFSLFGATMAAAVLVVACGGGGGDKDDAKKDDDTSDTTAAPTETTLPAGTSFFATAKVPQVAVYDAAEGGQETQSLANPIKSGAPLVFLVDGTDVSGTRLPVYLPVVPNESKGWIDANQVEVSANPYKITVELAEFKLTVTKNTETIIETPVGLGIPENDWDTPPGMYFIKELLKNPNPENVYGPYAYGTSAFTENPEVADQFGDGGVIGIHGNNDPSTIGTYASHGCIRLPNDKITEMVNILPLGTPVEILS